MSTTNPILSWPVLSTVLQMVANAAREPNVDPNYGLHVGDALRAIANDGHARNRLAGWWTDLATGQDKERNNGELMMLMVSELGEVPAYPMSMDEMDDKLPTRLMAEVELADFLVRVFDSLGGRRCDVIGAYLTMRVAPGDISDPRCGGSYQQLDTGLMSLVRMVSFAMEGDRKKKVIDGYNGLVLLQFDYALTAAAIMGFRLGARMGFDLPATMIEKMMFNAHRPDHKTENRKQEGGKEY